LLLPPFRLIFAQFTVRTSLLICLFLEKPGTKFNSYL